ncbi:hypothetical protein Vretimale_2504 [Volvox reticuliferus]|uniref:Uncharacterized protein n=1 Tax=Volvox reticuliferus TaxID=1737510 RepID=A0A8J4DD89_9CHLO|nr:hypothetical protein Vretifemale_4785 [Volvox reticuliferus]GIL96830.1 hypothetical protein Vretimale_2504 [Volvox reticuliferus]
MEFQRHVALYLFVTLIATASTTTALFQGEEHFRRLLSFLRSAGKRQAVDDFLLEPAEPHLLGPLWNKTDADFIQPSSSGKGSRLLKQVLGDELTLGGDPDPDPQPNPARRSLRNEDFVFAAPSSLQRLQLAQASRYWRKGMRAVFVLDTPQDRLSPEAVAGAARFQESYAWFPNYRRMANDKRDHYLEGDRRAAMTPILAYAALSNASAMTPWTQPAPAAVDGSGGRGAVGDGNHAKLQPVWPPPSATPSDVNSSNGGDPFLWMLSGDDDTIFFMRGVKALLRDYDPQLPYFITDSMYVGSKSPQPGVWEMRCYPCHLPWGRWRRSAARRLLVKDGEKRGELKDAASADGGKAPKGCGCSVQALCKKRFPSNETRCQTEWEGPVPFGGVGFIFSIGFFKALAAARNGIGLRAYEACIGDPETSVMSFPEGGDAFMSRCMWRLGFPITDPGYTPLGRYMGEVLHLKHFYDAPLNLSTGQLPDKAETRWSTAVSMHLGARQQKSFRAAAMTIKYISSVYDLVAELLWPTGRKAVL